MPKRIVVDTNVFVSRFMLPQSVSGRAVARIWLETQPLISIAAFRELREVLGREKFARYAQPGKIQPFLRQVWGISALISIASSIRACRDPKDDKFLELAVHGRADAIVTGDQDLLVLHPFRGIAILTPADYLARG
jgi:uncharacterized protein